MGCWMLERRQFGHRDRLTTYHHEMVEHSHINQAMDGFERLREGFVGV